MGSPSQLHCRVLKGTKSPEKIMMKLPDFLHVDTSHSVEKLGPSLYRQVARYDHPLYMFFSKPPTFGNLF